jgi:hypothetical protein
MKNLVFAFTITLIITGCGLFDKYQDNTHTWYHGSLTKAEKDSIKLNRLITKKWEGKNSNGDFSKGELCVIETGIKNYYEFVETGIWKERHSAAAAKGWRAIVKDSIVYDVMGNILFMEKFLDELNDDKGQYLYEKWTSTLSDSLRQTIILFYSNGQVKSKENLTVLDHNYLASDYNKEKRLTSFEAYLENGQKCSMSELTYDQWWEPGTKMKK